MTKNIRVTDSNGKELGYTYTKRAKGLIKNGRAQYVDDCTIRLSTIAPENISEAKQMKYILFNPREWSEKIGVERTFIDGFEGRLEEALQLGSWDGAAMAESKHYSLEADTEYTYVFWLNGGENDRNNEVCDLYIHFHGESECKNRYKLNRNYIRPLLHHKGWELYAISFATPEGTNEIDVSFSLAAKGAPMAVKAAKEPEYYADWKDEPDEFADRRPQRHNIVFEDGWPSIHMYGGNIYSTEVLKRTAQTERFAPGAGTFSYGVSKFDDDFEDSEQLEELEEALDEVEADHELMRYTLGDLSLSFDRLRNRCGEFCERADVSGFIAKISSMIEAASESLAKVKVEDFHSWLSRITSEAEGVELESALDEADGKLEDVDSMLNELEDTLDEFEDVIDELH